jgi:hypothetical protein
MMRRDRTTWRPAPHNPKTHPPITYSSTRLPGRTFATRAELLEAVTDARR